MSVNASRITGTGSHFPPVILTNDELVERLAAVGQETSADWIVERTGIQERRIARKGNPSDHNSSLAAVASLRALEMAGRKAEEIDLILYATCTPDTLIPSAACWLQQKIGASRAWAADLNAACSGFVFALAQADMAIRSGSAKTCLVVGADVLSAFTDWTDRGSCILFGDGAGAAVVEAVPAQTDRRIYSAHLLSDGKLWELFHMPAGGSNLAISPETIALHQDKMQMKGREIFKSATRTLAEFAALALDANGFKLSELDWLVPHQANLRIIEAVAKRLDFPMSKVIVNIDRHGNTSSGTVPTAFDEAVRDGRVKKGDLVLFDVFGAGLTYGSVLLRW